MERLHKFLAHAGVASRRHSEELIAAGRVTVNGRVVTELGCSVDPQRDEIRVDGELINEKEDKVYLVLNKPKGYLSTVSDPYRRPTVLDLIPDIKERVYPVGRLDFDTEGLLLLTNDGELADLLTHPRYQIPKTYRVEVKGVIDKESLDKLSRGVELEDGRTAEAEVELLSSDPRRSVFLLTLREGRKREVKRMCKAVGHPVLALKRISIGDINLEGLKSGDYRILTREEIKKLKQIKKGGR